MPTPLSFSSTPLRVHPKIPSEVLVLDGGLGSLVEKLGYAVDESEIWSSGALVDAPELVQKGHQM
jgi:S-methylmethionine-dependent homocysteine/selenocysteine methylase